jgi:hypothetical protein
MADKTPLRLVLDGNSDPSGLAEFQTGDTLPLSVGGLGASLSLGSAGQVLKVNGGGTAIEFGNILSNITLNDDTSSSISGQNFSILGGNGISTALSGSELIVSIDNTFSVSGTITSGNLLPPTDNTGVVGNSGSTWSNGQFTDLTVDDVLTVRTAIDLADGDILRFGTNDDWELFHDGTANRIDLNVGDLTIRDGITTRFTFGRTTGDFTTTGGITVGGDLTVNGTTTTINSTTVDVVNSFRFEGVTANDFETNLTVVDPTADRTITLPDATGTVVLKDTTDTLTNKSISLTTNTVTGTLAEFNTALSDADFSTIAGSETLTNKTLTSPVISTISNTGTLTLPTSTDTLVGRDTTDTLTNKTISGSNNTISGLDAISIGDGSVSNTEFQYLDGVTSPIQTQLNAAASTGKAIAMSIVFG